MIYQYAVNSRLRLQDADVSGGTIKSNLRWWLLSLAFFATAINYLDRQTLSVMAPVLLARFHISAIEYGRIIFAFMLAYTIMNGVSGRVLEYLGTRLGYSLCIAFWSGAELLHIFTRGALSLGVFRLLLGAGEAGNYPAGVRLIAEWFPPEERSHASGIFNSGAAVGAILAPPTLACIATSFGWRVAFAAVGLLGFMWLIVWLAAFPKRPDMKGSPAAEMVPTKALLRSRYLWQFTLSKFFSDPVWYFYTFWFPQYLKVAHGFSLSQIGKTAWIPFATATIGNLTGGLFFQLLYHGGLSLTKARRAAIVACSALMVTAIAVASIRGPALCIAVISVATFGYSAALANLLAVPGDVFPKDAVASIWGFASVGSGLGGMLFSLATGWIVQRYSFQSAFVLFGILPIISAALVWTLPMKAGISDGGSASNIARQL